METSAAGDTAEDVPGDVDRVRDDENLPRLFSLRFSTRSLSFAASSILVMQLTFYSTEIVGLSSALVGGLLLAARIGDAFTDLVVGAIVDRTNTRWGKARPYELFVVPMWIATVAVFSTPDMSPAWQAAYIFVFFFLITSVSHTFLAIADSVFLRRSIRGEKRHAKVLARQAILMIVFSVALMAVMPQMIDAWGSEPGGWTLIATVIGVPLLVIGLVRMLTIKELPPDKLGSEVKDTPTIRETISVAFRNRYIWVLASLLLLATAATGVPGTAGTYFWRYIYGDIGLASYLAGGAVLIAAAMLLFPVFVRRFGGAMILVRLGLVAAIIGHLVIFLFPHTLVAVAIGSMLGGMASIMMTMVAFFAIQAMTYGEWKTSVRVEGGVNSVVGFFGKVGTGLPPMIVGAALAVAGYTGGAESQPPAVDTMLIALMSLVPAFLCAVMLAVSFLWDLDKRMAGIQEDLDAGRTAATATDTAG